MVELNLQNQQITDVFTAGAAISEDEAVAVTGNNEVSPADDTTIQAAVGVAYESAQAGEDLEVVVIGRQPVTVDGAVNPGEPVIPAATSGRVVSETAQDTSHTHAETAHSHPVADHSHTMGTHSHTALETDGADAAPAAHQGVLAGDGGTDMALVAGVDSSGQAAESVPTDAVDPGDTNAGGSGSTDETDPGSTGSSNTAPQNARSLGMAVGTAAGAGEQVEVLVGYKMG